VWIGLASGDSAPDSLGVVTPGILRQSPSSGPTSRTAPIARISLAALRLNLRAVLSSARGGLIDVRADAWGHGLREIAGAALDSGAGALLVDQHGAAQLNGQIDPDRLVDAGDAASPEAVYGLTPGFAPVMSLRGRVLSTKPLRAGEAVSYGYTHRADHDTTIALVSGGYAQGVVRSLGNSASVWIAGRPRPIIGRVAMDVCVVDIGESAIAAGTDVVYFGAEHEGPALREWSAASGLTSAELVAGVGLRAEREYFS
jgi:alanine racemase